MDRGASQAIVHGVTKSQIGLKQLSTHAHTPNQIKRQFITGYKMTLYAVKIRVRSLSSCQRQFQCIHPEP